MGIVNVTPDSFSDGGDYIEHEAAIAHALKLADEGADIVDIGGESTRPPGVAYGAGASRVGADEEIARVVPVITAVHRARPDLIISVDTMKPAVAERAVDAGAGVVNDVSAGRYDERMLDVVAASECAYILMHGHDSQNVRAAEDNSYGDVVQDVFTFLEERISRAREAGIAAIVADVGLGFGKNFDDNITLLREHRAFLELRVPLLVGASRKAFLGRMLGGAPAQQRDIGTLAAHAAAVQKGASIVRTHDVRSAVQFHTVLAALYERSSRDNVGARGGAT